MAPRLPTLGLSLVACSLFAVAQEAPKPAAVAGQAQAGNTQPAQGQPAQGQLAQRPTGGAAPSQDAFKFGSPAKLGDGLTEPMMWPAATAEGWAKPVLVKWQRSFDDALALAKETGQPIMVAVNMDGEIASEHFAGVKYRDPEAAKLLEPYICVIGSVYRHTPRDYDEFGARVECPRFGTVTCGEHITCETELYTKYFEGLRVSPRHIVLEPSGKERYDVYYSWDTQTVLTAYVEAAKEFPPKKERVRDGLPLTQRIASPDIVDRLAVEQAYRAGTPKVRRELIEATLKTREVDQVELLRLALFGLDTELAKLARQSLALAQTEPAVDLIAEVLKTALPAEDRDLLVAAAERLGEKFPRAKTLATLHRGMALGSKLIDVAHAGGSTTEYEATSRRRAVSEKVEALADQVAGNQGDPQALLALSESFLARSAEPTNDRRFAELLALDARRAALEAEKAGAKGWRLDAALAAAADKLGERETALDRAVAAVEGGMLTIPAGEVGPTEDVKVRVLAMFALSRQLAIRKAYRERTQWPPEWMADVNAAYATLAEHPLVTDENLVSYHDFLRWLGASPRANAVLDGALARFPDSPLLHDRLRSRILWDKGPAGLISAYDELLAKPAASRQLTWYAGYAALVAAENFRRRNQFENALAAYDTGIAHYTRSANDLPEGRDLCQHFIALALAGKSRMALERGELEQSTQLLIACFERRPDSAATPDGLNLTPADTARMLEAKLVETKREDLLARLKDALSKLDPKLLELPGSEQGVSNPRGAGGPPPRDGNRPPRRG